MAIKLTDAQKAAVYSRGNVLVAAAAGSGKTAVLVERVIEKLCSKTDAVSADRLLIVTFTNAAAAEMRGRIEKRLDEKCRENPADTGLLLQKHLLASANICTIDSFCIDLVRENFARLGISPDFKIVDKGAISPINERVLYRIIAPYFEEKNADFLSLLDIVGTEYDEKSFISFVLRLYDDSRYLPNPKGWYEKLASLYGDGEFKRDNVWRKYAFDKALELIKYYKGLMAKAIDYIMFDEFSEKKYFTAFDDTVAKLSFMEELCANDDWDGFVTALNGLKFKNMPTIKDEDRALPDTMIAREIFSMVKSTFAGELKALFAFDSEKISLQFKKIHPAMKLLSKILIELDSQAFEELKQENIFTFHHTESMALGLLCDVGVDDNITLKPEGKEFLDRYDEVCVDEYQDTNDLQNMLFYVLSNKDSKLFAVGDLKQSIYGFRGANPAHFLHKKNIHIPIENANEDQPKKIILSENFRSKPDVCRFINYFFELFMTEKTGDIEYSAEEKLVPSGKFPQCDFPAVNMDIISTASSEDDKKILEARQIARFIKKVMASGKVIKQDDNTLRHAKYSDFTILLRGTKINGPIYAQELRKNGIPAEFSKEGFCSEIEISIMLSLLKVIDNPVNDVELLTVLMSPIFGVTAEEVADFRIKKRQGSLYSAVTLAAKSGNEKAIMFLEALERYRLYAVTNTLPRLVDILLDETGFLNIASAFPDGEKRRNNLHLLSEYAGSYTKGANADVGGFVRYIEKQSETGIKSAVANSADDSVTIMTIHHSKGLQFPVCIIADTATPFSTQESRADKNFTAKLGLGFKYFDEEERVKLSTLPREAILDSINSNAISEELRLLYVAMTRTQDIMYFVASVSNIGKTAGEIGNAILAHDFEITGDFLGKERSYFKWILTSLLLHPDAEALRDTDLITPLKTDSHIKIGLIDGGDLEQIDEEADACASEPDGDLVKELQENYRFEYPFKEILKVESRASASVLANKAESEKYSFSSRPAFMSDGGITATGRGTAMHKVMEFFDFSKWETPEIEVERLYEWQFINENEAESVNIPALKAFFESEVFDRIKKAQRVEREMRFITELPAIIAEPKLPDNLKNEKITVQGAVDVCFVEEDGVVILDFKTDRTDNPEDLKNAYAEQLNIYALACEKIFQKPIKEKIIYSFSLNKQITL